MTRDEYYNNDRLQMAICDAKLKNEQEIYDKAYSDGKKYGTNQCYIDIINQLNDEKIDINLISKVTNLSVNKIKKILEKKEKLDDTIYRDENYWLGFSKGREYGYRLGLNALEMHFLFDKD